MKTENTLKDQLLQCIAIQNKIIETDETMDTKAKEAFLNHGNQIKAFAQDKLTKAQFKSLFSEILTYWNEAIGPEVETFWNTLKAEGLTIERKDELQFALQKNRFRRVDQGIAARKHWEVLHAIPSIQERFSREEISQLAEIIEKDKTTRLAILQKCLRKNSIPKTQYLKFGECMAYFDQCELFSTHFTSIQVEQLYTIWENFSN